MKIAVVGATGLVGRNMIKVLKERNFPVTELIPVASERSVGKQVAFKGKEFNVVSLADGVAAKPAVALFSAGSEVSKEWAPKFADAGCYVIDNSSCWRMDPSKRLVVPEINGNIITKDDHIIANPNCSTIQMLVTVYKLHEKYGIKRIVVSTYQSVTGTGNKAVDQLFAEREGNKPAYNAYPYRIDLNIIPHIDLFLDNGYTKEEMKMVNETHKILSGEIAVSPTTVRVPVIGGHSESLNVEFENDITLAGVFETLNNTPGVKLVDFRFDNSGLPYPMPLYANEHDDVFVGRVRIDPSVPNCINLWCVSDNLRKGAATNAVQIAEVLISKGIIH